MVDSISPCEVATMSNNSSTNITWAGVGLNFSADDPGYQELIEINELLINRYGSTFRFDPASNPPHINLYDFDLPKKNLEELCSRLQEAAEQSPRFLVELGEIKYFDHGTIYIGCELSLEMKALEAMVVEQLNPLREGCRTEEYWQVHRKYTEGQKEQREKYGNPHVLETFYPHLTIGFLNGQKSDLDRLVDELNKNFSLKHIPINHIDLVTKDNESNILVNHQFPLRII